MTNGPDPAEQFAALFAAQMNKDTTANRIARYLAGQAPDPVEAGGRMVPNDPPARATDPSQGYGMEGDTPTDKDIAEKYFTKVIMDALGPSGMIKDAPPDFNVFN
jgi:hypothetical protein